MPNTDIESNFYEAISKVINSESTDIFEISDILELNISCDFAGKDISGVNFQNKDLSRFDFRNSILEDTNFRNANLSMANLENANLIGANLENANLIGANLKNANLSNTNLCGANLLDSYLDKAVFIGSKLNSKTSISITELDKIAIEKKREVIELTIDPPSLQGEAPIKDLGEIFTSFQELIRKIFQEINGYTSNSRLVVSNTNLNVYSIGVGSCKIGLVEANANENINIPNISDSMNTLVKIIEAGDNPEILENYLRETNKNIGKSYSELLKSLKRVNSRLEISIGSPIIESNRKQQTEISLDVLKRTYKELSRSRTGEKTTLEITGKFRAINSDTGFFSFQENGQDGRIIKGYMRKKIKSLASTASLGKDYQANILYENIYSLNSEHNKKKYTLNSFKSPIIENKT